MTLGLKGLLLALALAGTGSAVAGGYLMNKTESEKVSVPKNTPPQSQTENEVQNSNSLTGADLNSESSNPSVVVETDSNLSSNQKIFEENFPGLVGEVWNSIKGI